MIQAVHLKLARKWKMPQCLRLASVNASWKNEGTEVREAKLVRHIRVLNMLSYNERR